MTSEQQAIVDQIIDHERLTPLVQAATDTPKLRIDEWQRTTLSAQGRRTIFRFAGMGHEGLTPRPWSIILKEIKAPERADAIDHQMDCAFYWPRESLLYAAGVPQSLPRGVQHEGLRAPRCFGVMEPTPDLRWIWLEDLQDRYAGQWPLEQYTLAGYQLGIFNGSYLVNNPPPTAPWLTDNGLRSQSASKVADLARLGDPAIWTHPLLCNAYPTPILTELERLAADRERFLAGAATFPRTFCHLDAHADNMAAVEDANGAAETVLFDWALAGYGAPGEEISRLIWAALLDFKVAVAAAEQLERMVFDSYLQGLTDAGWQANSTQVRYAYLMSSVLIFTMEMEAVDHAWSEDVAGLEEYYGRPQERLVAQNVQVTYLLLKRADALRAMLDHQDIL